MNDQINITKIIATNADLVWTAISGIDGIDRWFPIIADCSVLGTGEGATRLLTLVDGGKIKDCIELIDHKEQILRYNRVESPFPVQRYIGTVKVCKESEASAKLSWTIDIEVQEEHRDELRGLIYQAISDGIDGLASELQQLNQI